MPGFPGEGEFPGEGVFPGLTLGGGVGVSWFEIELTSAHVEQPVVETPEIQQGVGFGGLITSGGGIPISAGEEEKLLVPGRTRPVPVPYQVVLGALPGRISAGQIAQFVVKGRGRTLREEEVLLKGTRREAAHWKAALQDDEAVLLAL